MCIFTHFLILTLLIFAAPEAAVTSDCVCPTVRCDECQSPSYVEFYTEKCGEGRVKSCSRIICVAKKPLPVACQKQKELQKVERFEIGKILQLGAKQWVLQDNSELATLVKPNSKVYNTDSFETGEDGFIKIELINSNLISIAENSKLKLDVERTSDSKELKKTNLILESGSVRSDVKTKSSHMSYFVQSPTSIAGAKGTDFMATYFPKSRLTRVQTLEGLVELKSNSGSSSVFIPAGTQASYVVDAVETDEKSLKYVEHGFMTPVRTLGHDEVEKIHAMTKYEPSKKVVQASRAIVSIVKKSDHICQHPLGEFNSCMWVCENNPKGEKTCRTDLQEVRCIRKRCNANGEWAEPTRLPASFSQECSPHGPRVSPCDY